MTKEDLIKFIQNLDIDEEVEVILLEAVDAASEVNQELLNFIADVLEKEALFLEAAADILTEDAEAHEQLADEIDSVVSEAMENQLNAVADAQEEVINDLEQKMKEFKSAHPDATPESPEVQQVKDQLQAHIESTQTSAASLPDAAQAAPAAPGISAQPTDQSPSTQPTPSQTDAGDQKKPAFKLW